MKKVLFLIVAAFAANLAECAVIPTAKVTETRGALPVVSMNGHRVLGIVNEGGACWFNATMQFFHGIPEFRALLSKIDAVASVVHTRGLLLHNLIMSIFNQIDGIDDPTRFNISDLHQRLVLTIQHYCPEYTSDDLPPIRTNPKVGGDASKLATGLVRSLEKEILGLFWENKRQHTFEVEDLFKKLEEQPNAKTDSVIKKMKGAPKNSKAEKDIIELYQRFCSNMYYIAEITPICPTCYHQEVVKLKRGVIRPNLKEQSDLSSLPRRPQCSKCHPIEAVTKIFRQGSTDIFQVVNTYPDNLSLYTDFVATDANFARMQAAMIICVPTDPKLAGERHSMAVVRKDASHILVINDIVVAEYTCDSWHELEEIINRFNSDDRFHFTTPLEFKCVEMVAFSSSPVR
ncbi:MAG: hypothetical protein K6C34_04350 [Alphaproteobacteria bacterium]|nr:hypothetical protein [Alphaproteobacteria bacterium]